MRKHAPSIISVVTLSACLLAAPIAQAQRRVSLGEGFEPNPMTLNGRAGGPESGVYMEVLPRAVVQAGYQEPHSMRSHSSHRWLWTLL